MSDRQLMIFAAWILPLIYSVARPYSVIDLAGWIAHGQYFLEHHELLRKDIFSVLPTRPLVYPAWAVSILYALIYRASDLMTVCLFHSAVLGTVLWIVYRNSIATLRTPLSRIAIYALALSWLGSFPVFNARPSEVALIPFCLAFVWISRIERLDQIRPRLILKLCLLNIFWVNIHGSFILLWLMLIWKSLFLAISERKGADLRIEVRWQLIAQLCIGLSSLANPFFFDVFPYLVETAEASRNRMLAEWQPTTIFAHPPLGILFFALVAVVAVMIVRGFKRPDFWFWISSPFFLLLLNAFSGIRNVALPFIVVLPTMKQMGYLDSKSLSWENWNKPKAWNWVKVAPVAAAFVLALPGFRTQVFKEDVVSRIGDAIRSSKRTCPVFNSWNVGSFLMLNVPNRIFIDSRNIIYGDDQLEAHHKASQALPGWSQYLDKYGACFAVIQAETPLARALQTSPQWKRIAEENGYSLFEKTE